VSRILPTVFVNGSDADSGIPLAANVDPVVMTGILNAPTKTGETASTRKPPPKEPPPKELPPIARKPGTVRTEPGVYRPKLPSLYVEPDLGADLLDGMELIHKEYGRSIRQAVDPLPERTDSIAFDPLIHQKEFDSNIRWGLCPVEHQATITDIVRRHWDCFAEEGLKKHIRGFSCRIDTGDVAPICCKQPRYGPHEASVMTKLVYHLQQNGLIEDNYGPWGALIVLASKANQEEIPWHEYIWRLCVSYRRLNQVVRPFAFPIRRCDDAVADIPPWAKCFLSFDLDCGYWQVALDAESRDRTAFFTPNGKKHWTVMPMGFLNSHAIFVAMMEKLKETWNKSAGHSMMRPHKAGAEVIVDDVILYSDTTETLFEYFEAVLEVLQFHCVTIKLKKTKWLEPELLFVGRDISAAGNSPALSKFAAFESLPAPKTWSELRMIVGMFGFYQGWIERYELRIAPYRRIQARQPMPGQVSRDEETEFFAGFWLSEHQELFEALKREILDKPVLARPDPNRRFYVKTDWCCDGMAAALLQADPDDDEALIAESAESLGGSCFFDLQRKGLRLRPIEFISRSTSGTEKSFHSYVGEASVGRWAFPKWRRFLLGRPFTWLSDCSGLKRFFEGDDPPTHAIQRWRQELLLYQFTFEHRPADMLTECDVLSRYNMATAAWRAPSVGTEVPGVATAVSTATSTSLALPTQRLVHQLFDEGELQDDRRPRSWFSLPPVVLHGRPSWSRPSKLSNDASAQQRVIVVTGAATVPIDHALELLGAEGTVIRFDSSVPPRLASHFQLANQTDFFDALPNVPPETRVDWFVAVYTDLPKDNGAPDNQLNSWVDTSFHQALALIDSVHLSAAIIMCPFRFPSAATTARKRLTPPTGWKFQICQVRNTHHGGLIETDHEVLLLIRNELSARFVHPDKTMPPSPMGLALEPDPDPTTFLWLPDLSIALPSPILIESEENPPYSAHKARLVKLRSDAKPYEGWPVFCPSRPAPNISRPRPEEVFFSTPFAIWLQADANLKPEIKPGIRPISTPDIRPLAPVCRPVSVLEILRLLGLMEPDIASVRSLPEDLVLSCARSSPGSHGLANLFLRLTIAEVDTEESDIPGLFAAVPEDQLSLLPIPTDNQWRQATREDPDLLCILTALAADRIPEARELNDNTYLAAIQRNQVECESGIVYYYERSRAARLRQLRTKVVPASLRQTVISACHSSPFAGHSGITRTLFRVQTRFWWPGVVRDVTDGVRGCAHCNLANATSHEQQSLLHTLSCDVPFDVVYLDIWSPGELPDKYGNVKVLTFIDCMTGFAMATFLSQGDIDARTIADAALTAFFGAVGLPRLVIVDADSLFAGVFKQLFQILRIPVDAVSRENHKAIRNERFHRYLNKVQRINTADVDSLFRWKQGVLFSLYAWNAAPIDGTDLPRSVVAIGRDFPFPIDLSTATARDSASEGEAALDHFESASPLLYKQRQLLVIQNAERRQRHIDIRNEGIKQRSFDTGDLVIVRKQVQSNASKGISAKLLFKTRGPYRVIEKITPSSYKIQRLPFCRGLGRPGRFCKENVARMEKIPSTLILHRRVDGADTRFSQLHGEFADTPLSKWLGVLRPGAYQQAPSDSTWAYESLASMWTEDDALDDSDDDSSSDNDDDHVVDAHEPDEDDMDQQPSETNAGPLLPASPTALPPLVSRNETTRTVLQRLFRQVSDSMDALFFVSYTTDPAVPPIWRLGQVDKDDSSPSVAQQSGVYRVRWWSQQHDDATSRSITDSRFWPSIYKLRADGSTGQQYPVRPVKIDQTLANDPTLRWLAEDFPLAECFIVGPFDFHQKRIGLRGTKRRAISETNHVDNIYWQQLEQQAHLFGIATTTIRYPPPKPQIQFLPQPPT
jgi:hypothetical protein